MPQCATQNSPSVISTV